MLRLRQNVFFTTNVNRDISNNFDEWIKSSLFNRNLHNKEELNNKK